MIHFALFLIAGAQEETRQDMVHFLLSLESSEAPADMVSNLQLLSKKRVPRGSTNRDVTFISLFSHAHKASTTVI